MTRSKSDHPPLKNRIWLQKLFEPLHVLNLVLGPQSCCFWTFRWTREPPSLGWSMPCMYLSSHLRLRTSGSHVDGQGWLIDQVRATVLSRIVCATAVRGTENSEIYWSVRNYLTDFWVKCQRLLVGTFFVRSLYFANFNTAVPESTVARIYLEILRRKKDAVRFGPSHL